MNSTEFKIERNDLMSVLLNSIPDLIFISQLNYGKVLSNFLFANKTALEILGYNELEIIYLNPLSVIFSNLENKMIEILTELEIGRKTIFDSNLISKNGEEISSEIHCSMIYYNSQNLILFSARPNKQSNAREKIIQLNQKLRRLALRLQAVREDERKSIARELHDELGQNLTALKIFLSMLKKGCDDNELLNKINEMIKICDSTINSIQSITAKLRPELLDELGLIPAIEYRLKKFSEQTGIKYDILVSSEKLRLDSESEIALFRIFQEALTNIARHSNASKVRVNLTTNDHEIIFEIFDNGKGITQNQIESPNSLGILGMKERTMVLGGEFVIKSTMNSGTLIKVKIPLRL